MGDPYKLDEVRAFVRDMLKLGARTVSVGEVHVDFPPRQPVVTGDAETPADAERYDKAVARLAYLHTEGE